MSMNTIIDEVTNSSPESQLDKAFADIAEQFEKHGSVTLPNTDDDKSKDSFNNTDEEPSENQSEVTLDQSQSDVNLDANNTTQPVGQQIPENNSSNNNDISVEQLKEELRKKEIDIQLQHSRLNDLSARYQELKAYADMTLRGNGAYGKTLDSSQEHNKSSEAVKEFLELYPDMAEAVSQMIEEKTSAVTRSFEEALNNRVIPIQQHLEHNATQAFINKVMAAHPDAQQIVQSQALRTWAESLDPIRRSGVNTVMQYGNADEVITLLNQYKQDTKQGYVSPSMSVGSSSNGNLVGNTSSRDEDAIAKKVLSMLNLPSNTQEPVVIKTQSVPVYSTVSEAFEALCAEQEGKR